ncbi:MAG: hypothetical protein KY464_15185 [Gemmatimonadetes bacterium]|nr:hypothetical protein [Gemmatimonadota bacterium]
MFDLAEQLGLRPGQGPGAPLPVEPEYRCRWCDRPLPDAQARCGECAERELERRIGQRGPPEVVRGILDEMLTLVDLREMRAEIEAYDAAVRAREGVGAARRALEERLEPAPPDGVPTTLAESDAWARDEALRAILTYPYGFEESLRHAARAAARCFGWIVARRVVPEGPAAGEKPADRDLLEWIEGQARDSAWRSAFLETTTATEARLYARFLARLRDRIDSGEESATD